MADLLDGPLIRVGAAKEHIHLLKTEIAAFLDMKPGSAFTQSDPEGLKHVVRLQITPRVPTDRWRVIVSEAVHHLRSSLEEFIRQMILSHGRKPGDDFGFPICGSSDNYAGDKTRIALEGKLPEAAMTLIKVLQPYNNPYKGEVKLNPLWLLKELYNIDKHHLLNVVGVFPISTAYSLVPPTIGTEVILYEGPLEDGAILAEIKPPNPDPEMQVQLQQTVEVAIDATNRTPRLGLPGVLEIMVAEVERAFHLLRPALGPKRPPSERRSKKDTLESAEDAMRRLMGQ